VISFTNTRGGTTMGNGVDTKLPWGKKGKSEKIIFTLKF
jgi:hypothetical protein